MKMRLVGVKAGAQEGVHEQKEDLGGRVWEAQGGFQLCDFSCALPC